MKIFYFLSKIENEYGSFYACDHQYTQRLRDLIKKYVDNAALLYTTDGSYKSALKCGPVKGAYATVDFGTAANVTKNFQLMREIEPKVEKFIFISKKFVCFLLGIPLNLCFSISFAGSIGKF